MNSVMFTFSHEVHSFCSVYTVKVYSLFMRKPFPVHIGIIFCSRYYGTAKIARTVHFCTSITTEQTAFKRFYFF